jgi:hypothetical protein
LLYLSNAAPDFGLRSAFALVSTSKGTLEGSGWQREIERRADFARRSLAPAAFFYDTRHAAKVAYAVSGVRSGLRVNSKTETFSNWTR